MAHRIKKCLIGAKYTSEIAELTDLGIAVIPLPKNPLLDEEISNHADILSFRVDDDLLLIDSKIAGEIEPLVKPYAVFSVKGITSPYPNDIKLNCAVIGNKIVLNEAFAHDAILQYAYNNYEIISTKQGYAKCNLCIVNDGAVITEDKGLSSLLKNYQIDVLTIQSGYVALSDKHYGFIGGAGVRLSDNEIYFSGDISAHPDYNDIMHFLHKYGFTAIFNQNRPLRDFGGFIAID